MGLGRYLLISGVLAVVPLLLQADDYPAEKENVLHKTTPGKQLKKDDEPCGAYLWKSSKVDPSGAVALYYFYGSTEYGKGKMGLFQLVKFRAEANEEKDPPTAQIVKDSQGIVKEVILRMTKRELEASRACFPEK